MSLIPVGPPDASVNPRYAGVATFARLPRLRDVLQADIVALGVPVDYPVQTPGMPASVLPSRMESRSGALFEVGLIDLTNDLKNRVGRLLTTRTRKDKDV